jgi:glycerate 2-kinase
MFADPDEARQSARETILELFQAALDEVDPRRAVRTALECDGRRLTVGERELDIERGVHVIALGKAAVAMTLGALDHLGEAIVSGTVITNEGQVSDTLPERISVSEAGHPIPDERSVRATRQALARLSELEQGIVVLALISGGGSALLEAPRQGFSLQDLAEVTGSLLRAGAPIEDLNAVRAPLSRVKAGGLRATAPSATWVTLILSDVLGNDPRIIASGPTVPGWNDPQHAMEIVDRYALRGTLPAGVINFLERTRGERDSAITKDVLLVIGDNVAAAAGAERASRCQGFTTRVIWEAAVGEASKLGREWVDELVVSPESIDVVLGGGEATVTVRGDGRGGRNTEFALAAALELERRALDNWVVASLATDGQDALTGLAGAIVDSRTCRRARERGIDPQEALWRNDSLSVIDAADAAVATGPTGTNVNDLYFAVRIRPREVAVGRVGA